MATGTLPDTRLLIESKDATQELADEDLGLLADSIPSSKLEKFAIIYLGLSRPEVQHCAENAKQKSNVPWHHSLYCLLLWRDKQKKAGSRARLYDAFSRATEEDGIIPREDFSFLQEQEPLATIVKLWEAGRSDRTLRLYKNNKRRAPIPFPRTPSQEEKIRADPNGNELEKTDLTIDDLNRLARKIPSSLMEEVGIKHLSLTMVEINHCSDLARQTSNFSYHHSLYCLLLWREREQTFGGTLLRRCLFYHLKQAQEGGLIGYDSISFLEESEDEDIYATCNEWERTRSQRNRQLYANLPAKSPKSTPRNSSEGDHGNVNDNVYAEPRDEGKPHSEPPSVESLHLEGYSKPSNTEGSQAKSQERRPYTELGIEEVYDRPKEDEQNSNSELPLITASKSSTSQTNIEYWGRTRFCASSAGEVILYGKIQKGIPPAVYKINRKGEPAHSWPTPECNHWKEGNYHSLLHVTRDASEYIAVSCCHRNCREITIYTESEGSFSAYKDPRSGQPLPGPMCKGPENLIFAINMRYAKTHEVIALEYRPDHQMFVKTSYEVNIAEPSYISYLDTDSDSLLIASNWENNAIVATSIIHKQTVWEFDVARLKECEGFGQGDIQLRGMCCDTRGHLYVGEWNKPRVLIIDGGSGRLIQTLELPELHGAIWDLGWGETQPHLAVWHGHGIGNNKISYYDIQGVN